MSKDIKKQAAELLANGVKPQEVASKLSVSPSYIAQLKDDEEFLEMLKTAHAEFISRRGTVIAKQQSIDDKIQDLELKTLEAFERNLQMMLVKPDRALKMFQVLNSAKRRNHESEHFQNKTGEDTSVVTLQLPKHIEDMAKEIKVIKNENNEVVGIGQRVFKSLPTSVLFQAVEDNPVIGTVLDEL